MYYILECEALMFVLSENMNKARQYFDIAFNTFLTN